jgi:hypothetical protein
VLALLVHPYLASDKAEDDVSFVVYEFLAFLSFPEVNTGKQEIQFPDTG